MTPTPSTLLKYINLQMASEALLDDREGDRERLTTGNNRSSKFPAALADQFLAEGWVVVNHKADTSTGFSGTLFRNSRTGEQVISFRSTEFIDDAARDNQETNKQEIAAVGWAFGQIDDMEKWYAGLMLDGLIDSPVTVTGYSLGGHLATAFTQLRLEQGRGSEIAATYTFNGAGVGNVSGTLTDAAFKFRALRDDASALMQTAGGRSQYAQLKASLGNTPTVVQLTQAISTVGNALAAAVTNQPVASPLERDLNVLLTALQRASALRGEVDRVNAGIIDFGSGGDAKHVAAGDVAGLRLDYQLAVLGAAQSTSAYRTDPVRSGFDGYAGRHQKGVLPNFYDVFGDTAPSSVSNSQWHYGQATPVFIEDQPLWRGDVLFDVVAASYAYSDTKLLVPFFSQNDFGDTHSLVLLVDSLSVQNALATLAPTLAPSTLSTLLRSASNARAVTGTGPGNQGMADGDSLEHVIDALGRLIVNKDAPAIDVSAQMAGNTWADPAYRQTFYAALTGVTTSAGFLALTGKVTIDASSLALVASARNGFSSLASLIALSPFTLAATDGGSQAVLDGVMRTAWGTTYTDWQTDKTLSQADIGAGRQTYTDHWIADRALLLQAELKRNIADTASANVLRDPSWSEDAVYIDSTTSTTVTVSRSSSGSGVYAKVQFGAAGSETLNGTYLADRLYGGAGNDTLFGLDGADHLEGNVGDDVLYGGSRDDTLVGGAGFDTLEGGSGNDSLLGGDAADQLDGGSGDDFLSGGEGLDNYFFGSSWGNDSIEDSDGKGALHVVGFDPVNGTGTTRIDNVWTSTDKRITYTLLGIDANRNDLLITFKGIADSIRIRDWSQGKSLGITLATNVTPPPAASTTFIGDFNKFVDGTSYRIGSDGNYLSIGYLADAQDLLNGSDGNDDMSGLGGNDGIAGRDGDDHIDGGSGRDLLLGGYGADTILGGSGADTIFGSDSGAFTLPTSTTFTPVASTGVEYARGFNWVTYLPPAAPNYLVAGAGNIYPNGETEGNLIDGGSGDDIVYAGTGADTVHGGADNDELNGMGGADILFGDAGDDYIRGDGSSGANGAYTPYSEHGDDILIGGEGADTLIGQGGDDELDGGTGDDFLQGDDNAQFDDTPFSIHGRDTLDGGAGNDELGGNGGDDDLYGGTGDDTLFGDSDPARIPGSYHGNDYLDGEDGNDFLDGGGKDDTLFGGAGDDVLWGDSNQPGLAGADMGNDALDGEAGNDVLTGGGKDDTLFGGSGNDSLRGDGEDVAAADAGRDYLDGEDGDDLLEGDGGDDILFGSSGSDTLSGGLGDDYLDGGTQSDRLRGDAGNDTLVGGAGADDLDGGAGDDTYIFSVGDSPNGNTAEIEGIDDALGHNTIVIQDADIDQARVLTDGNGTLLLEYSSGDWLAVVNGIAGVDDTYQLFGSEYSTEELVGLLATGPIRSDDPDGKEHVLGGRNDDAIASNKGGTVFSGGRGNDTLTGGGGSNRYGFSRGDGSDTLTDTGPKTNAQGQATLNSIVFGRGILPADVHLSGAAGRLTLTVGDSADQDSITFGSFDQSSAAGVSPIDLFVFANGTTLTYAELVARGFDGDGANDTISGTAGDDRIDGHDGDDLLLGQAGNDTLVGGAGNDTLIGGTGDDVYVFGRGSGSDTIDSTGAGADTLRLTVTAPADIALEARGSDLLITLVGFPDRLLLLNYLTGSPLGRIEFAGGVVWSPADVQAHLPRILTEGSDNVVGTDGPDVINALGGNDTVNGLGGADLLDGGIGNDSLVGGAGNDTLLGGDGLDVLQGDADDDRLDGGAGNDLLFGGEGADLLLGGLGDDQLRGGNGNDRLDGGDGNDVVVGEGGDDILIGGAGQDRLEDYSGNNSLSGGDGADTLYGGAGNDTLDGGAGAGDALIDTGGDNTFIDGEYMAATGGGNDTYIVGTPGVTVQITDNGGANDVLVLGPTSRPGSTTVEISPSGLNGYFNNLFITGAGFSPIVVSSYFQTQGVAGGIDVIRFGDGTSWTYADVLARLAINNITEGSDRITGFAWNDVIDARGGDDYVQSDQGDDRVDGGSGNDTLYGATGNDTLLGSDGNDELSGAEGADVLRGGAGNDTLLGDIDWLNGSAPSDGNDDLDGGDGNDSLFGGGGDDTLQGGAGNDTLRGASGNDTYRLGFGSGRDFIVEGGGTDRVQFDTGVRPADVTLLRDGNDLLIAIGQTQAQARVQGGFNGTTVAIEQFQFTDGTVWSTADIIARIVVGTPNAMVGTLGNDTFVVDDAGDTISEPANGGIDTVQSSISYTLGANLENLTLTGYGDISGTGNALNNSIVGNAGNNVLSGGAGADTLAGGAGDDVYVLTDGSAVIVEETGGGIDSVTTRYDYTLPTNVENLNVGNPLQNWQLRLTGNASNNVITGQYSWYHPYTDIYDGGLGADTMIALGDGLNPGRGIFYVDNPGDVIVSPIASVFSSIDWTLAAGHSDLSLIGSSAVTATGNSGANVLDGSTNSAANTLVGGLGDDVYVVGLGDRVVETAGQGTDTVRYNHQPSGGVIRIDDLGAASIERYGLGANVGGNVTLVGSSGSDNLFGDGLTSLGFGSYAGDTLNGMAGNDTLTGNSGNDRLDGGTGNDSMFGGGGNDTYVVDSVGDTIVDLSGIDTVESSIDWTLQAGLEGLTLTGSAAIRGTGNAAANTLDGSQNSSGNVLAGLDGDDRYIVGVGDTVVELAGGGYDWEQSAVSLTLADEVEAGALLGNASVSLAGNRLDNELYGNEGDNVIDGGAGADRLSGQGGNDTYVVDSTGDTVLESFGGGIDRVRAGISYTLAANVENLTLTGTGAIDGTGNGLANAITGNAAANRLRGGVGNDTLDGAGGDDTYLFGLGDGADVIARATADASPNQVNALSFLAGIATSDVALARVGNDLVASIIRTTDSVTVQSYFAGNGPGNPDNPVQRIGFADGTVWDGAEIAARVAAAATNHAPTLVAPIPDRSVRLGQGLSFTIPAGSFADVDAGDVLTYQASVYGSALPSWLNLDPRTGLFSGTAPASQWPLYIDVTATDRFGLSATDQFTLSFRAPGGSVIRGTAGADSLQSSDRDDTLYGGAGNDTLYGSLADNFLSGDDGDDYLYGQGGSDTFVGGAGNDYFNVDSLDDVIVENADEGRDTVAASVDWTLGANLESLYVGGSASRGTGNALNNSISSNGSGTRALTLDGGAGADTLQGGFAGDTYIVDNVGDQIYESASYFDGTSTILNTGVDLVRASVSYTLAAGIENLTLTGAAPIDATGNALGNVLTGNAAANRLDGQGGADSMAGGAGNDTYVVDQAGDVIVELAGGGNADTVEASLSWTLGAELENLTLTGTAAIDGTGNAAANRIVGNTGANALRGGAGSDSLDGGAGNDLLDGGSGDDEYAFGRGSGNDTIASLDPTAGKSDTLRLGAGLSVNDVLVTRVANDLLVAIRGSGDSIRVRDQFLDGSTSGRQIEFVQFADGTVWDRAAILIQATMNHAPSLVSAAFDQNVAKGSLVDFRLPEVSFADQDAGDVLSYSASLADGTPLPGWLTFDAATLRFRGDSSTAALGTETVQVVATDPQGLTAVSRFRFSVQPAGYGRVVRGTAASESIGATGTNDTIYAGAGDDYVYGAGGNDLLYGEDGNDTFSASAGVNILVGGRGNDLYFIDSTRDTVVEYAGEGTDAIRSSIDYVLPDNVENLTIAGTATRGTGNALANLVADGLVTATGKILDGGAGADTLQGGLGDDTYYVDNAGDVIVEYTSINSVVNTSVDTVYSSVSYYLTDRLEKLVLTGAADIDGSAGAGNKVLVGNAGSNRLTAWTGNDTLDGGGGADFLDGGAGDDTYLLGRGSGLDTISSADYAAGKLDTLQLKAGIAAADVLLHRDGDDLVVVLRGSADAMRIRRHFDANATSAYRLDQIRFDDGTTWGLAAIQARLSVNQAPTVASPLADRAATQGVAFAFALPANSFADPDPDNVLILSAMLADGSPLPSWLSFDAATRTFSGTGPAIGLGVNSIRVVASDAGGLSTSDVFDLTVQPASGGNVIHGTAGDDVLTVGNGNDTVLAGAGNDRLIGGVGDNLLVGEAGNDTLGGGAGDDTLDGGTGDDLLDGGAGNDTYRFDRGAGNDSIAALDTAAGRLDVLELGAGLAVGDVRLSRQGDDLLVAVRGSTDAIVVRDHFSGNSAAGSQIDQIRFADGTHWDTAAIAFLTTNHAPTVSAPLADRNLVQGSPFLLVVPAATFGDVDADDVLTYGATLAGGLPLPAWLHFDATTRTLSGDSAGAVVGASSITLTATDRGGLSVSDTFDLTVQAPPDGYAIYGTGGDDVLTTGATNDTVYAGAGNDRLTGGVGRNLLLGEDGNDTLDGGAGDDTLDGGAGDDLYLFGRGAGHDRIRSLDTGVGKSDTLRLASGIVAADVDLARDGDDLLLVIRDTADSVRVVDQFVGGSASGRQIDQVRFADGTSWNAATLSFLTTNHAPTVAIPLADQGVVRGSIFNLAVPAATFADVDAGDRLVYSASLDDGGPLPAWLAFDPATRTFTGDSGAAAVGISAVRLTATDRAGLEISDVFLLTVAAETGRVIDGTPGDDTLQAGLLDDTIHGGAGNDLLLGGIGDNQLFGDDGADTLAGGDGNDLLAGGRGDDTYVVDDLADVIVENAGDGVDTVRSSVSFNLGANLETLVLTGTAAIDGTGNILANRITGNDAANRLDGGVGADTMIGAGGDDSYTVDVAGDVVVELPGGGIDTVRSAVTYTLGAELEHLILTGTARINGTGNAADNAITGNAGANSLVGNGGNDTLDGGLGADTLAGGLGDDVYVVDDIGDRISEAAGAGIDTVEASIDFTLGSNLERLVLRDGASNGTGNTLANVVTGNAGRNLLNGGSGADTLVGRGGDDTYIVDNVGDVVVEAAGEGNDSVASSVSYTLGADVENLTLSGSSGLSGTGNGSSNVITGNGGANRLDGRGGADTLLGGLGNDVYVVDDAGDVVVEAADAGTDAVEAGLSWILGANLEKLTLTGTSAIDGTGNDLANTLLGNAGANRLDGAGGADSMTGGLGDDTYVVDNAGDKVTEANGGGVDTVESSISYVLGSYLENLILTGSGALAGTGNTLANRITGNDAANALSGGSGADTMVGGDGDDSYVVDNVGDVAVEAADEGIDTVASSVSFALGSHVENLTLTGTSGLFGTGNALANVIRGNAGSNRIDGGLGADTMDGGLGSDTYVVDDAGDVVIEAVDAGTDAVEASVSYALSANIEKLTLTGVAGIDGIGNALANTLTGNAGNNRLDGGAGVDTLTGGAGDDVYGVDNVADKVVEGAGAGIDRVESSVTWTLGTNLEDLTLLGADAINGTGNAAANVVIGNAGANTLSGSTGNDTLVGGLGNDTYLFNKGFGSDTIDTFDAAVGKLDTLRLGTGIRQADLIVSRSLDDDLLLTIKGTSDSVRVLSHFADSEASGRQIDLVRFADGSSWNVAQIHAAWVSGHSLIESGALGHRMTIQPLAARISEEPLEPVPPTRMKNHLWTGDPLSPASDVASTLVGPAASIDPSPALDESASLDRRLQALTHAMSVFEAGGGSLLFQTQGPVSSPLQLASPYSQVG